MARHAKGRLVDTKDISWAALIHEKDADRGQGTLSVEGVLASVWAPRSTTAPESGSQARGETCDRKTNALCSEEAAEETKKDDISQSKRMVLEEEGNRDDNQVSTSRGEHAPA